MKQTKSKKLNNHQKLITAISIVVVLLLAICVTFAWYTNRVFVMKGTYRLGSFGYQVSLYDVNMSEGAVTSLTQKGTTHTYTRQNTDTWELADETYSDFASGSVKYQLIKVYNQNSGFDIKAYEYLKYDTTMTPEQETLANAFYFKPVKLALDASTEYTDSQIVTYLNNNSSVIPAPTEASGGIASPESEITFGKMKDNAIALEGGSIATGKYAYYLVGYCVTGLSDIELNDSTSVSVQPVITIGQANGPVPQSSAETVTREVDTWPDLRAAIIAANDGDTVRLTANVESPNSTDLNITNGINLDLNSYNLTVHGNVRFNYKTAEERKLILTAPSVLTADGNLIIETKGPFNIYSNVAQDNIKLGTGAIDNEITQNLVDGFVKVNCGLYYRDVADSDGLKPVVDENSGLTLNNVIIKQKQHSGSYGANGTLKLIGADTMIKIAGGSHLEKITTESVNVGNIFIANYGVINTIDLHERFTFTTNKVGLYIKNYNIVNNLELPNGIKGYITAGSETYNTRLIDSSGCVTSFKNADGVTDNSVNDKYSSFTYFKSADVEPSSMGGTSSFVCDDSVNGVYSLYLRNTTGNTDASAEDLATLFATDCPGDSVSAVRTLKVNTVGSVTVNTYHFHNDTANEKYGIADLFTSLKKLDLSNTVLKDRTIPAGAMQNASLLSDVVFSTSSFGIGANAFKGTAISKITLGTNLDSTIGIGSQAFYTTGNLEVIWNNPSTVPSGLLGAFDSTKTLIFMEKQYAERAETDHSSEWALNMYEFYDFKAKNNTYYCKYNTDGLASNGCEIIYFAGTLYSYASAQDKNIVPYTLSDGTQNYDVVSVNRQAFRKAILAGSANTVTLDLKNCLRVGKGAFQGTESAVLKLASFGLGKVNRIGNYAFMYNKITYSAPREAGYSGMISLGERVFENTSIYGGVLDLSGPSQGYSPADYALAGLTVSGGYESGEAGNALVDLRNITTVPSHFAISETIEEEEEGGGEVTIIRRSTGFYCNVDLRGCNTIEAGAFTNSIYKNNNETPTNIVDIRDIYSIGIKSFNGIGCGELRIGTHDDIQNTGDNNYKNIIGSGSIKKVVLDGTFITDASNEVPALASNVSSETLLIEELFIAKYEVNDEVQITTIPAYAFASSSSSSNLEIQAVTVDSHEVITGEPGEEVTTTVYDARYNIDTGAFYNTDFSTSLVEGSPYYYRFFGAVNVGAKAFMGSTIQYLSLGENVVGIGNWNFIQYCDSIKRLWIERPGQIVSLSGGVANAKLSSAGTELDTTVFKIEVPSDLLTAYVQDAAWAGWRNYFGALYYTYDATIAGAKRTTEATGIRWYYNKIQYPGNNTVYAQIIKCEAYNFSTNTPISLPSSGSLYLYFLNGNPSTSTAGLGRIRYDEFRLKLPQHVGDSDEIDIKELGGDEDLFEDLTLSTQTASYVYRRNNRIQWSSATATTAEHAQFGSYVFEADDRFILDGTNLEIIDYISPAALSSSKIKSIVLSTTSEFARYRVTNENQLYYRINDSGATANSGYVSNSWDGSAAHLELVKVLPSYFTSATSVTCPTCSNSISFKEADVINGAYVKCPTCTVDEDNPVLVKVETVFTIPEEVEAVQESAFEGCSHITKIDLEASTQASGDTKLISIGANAFLDADNITVFDFTNTRKFISISRDAFGKARSLGVNENGYYDYFANSSITIKIPAHATDATICKVNAQFKNSGEYYFYKKYGILQEETVVLGASTNGAKSSALTLKKNEADATLAGIGYHLMTGGTEYNGKTYASDTTQFIAVVTGLSPEAAASKTLVIPATVVVRGISYDVVGITDSALGRNEAIETLVLPNKSVTYSSVALAACPNLGIIQYSNIVPLAQAAETVAALPVPSAQSLIESSKNDEEN